MYSSYWLLLLVPFSCPRNEMLWMASAFTSNSVFRKKDIRLTRYNTSENKKEQDLAGTGNVDAMSKVSWYAAEALGSIVGRLGLSKTNLTSRGMNYRKSPSLFVQDDIDILKAPLTVDETITRIQYDNDRCYFLSGQVDVMIYDPNCLFSDPFVAFNGRERFVNNLKNLNTFITRYDAKLLSVDYPSPLQVKTKILVKLELNLPWKPILAWPWGVSYIINSQSNLIVEHRESWDIDPLQGVLQVFRKPTITI